tara:strand:- start:556 stop:717 length:162 start_codon:yes stop_codon:yes gene_type:complete
LCGSNAQERAGNVVASVLAAKIVPAIIDFAKGGSMISTNRFSINAEIKDGLLT